MNRLTYILALACLLASCSAIHRKNAGDDVAVSLHGKTLSRTQLEQVTQAAETPEDSAMLAEAYIRQWAGDVLFYDRATKLRDNEIEELVEAYRRELYMKRYEDKLVLQKMDHTLSDDTIRAYYDQHPELFELNTALVKGVLLTLPVGSPNVEKLRIWLHRPMQEIEKIEKYAYQYATGYELFTDKWKTSNQLLLKMPVGSDALNSAIRQQQQIEVRDSAQIYILQLTDKRFIGDEMPLELAEPEIRKIMLQERRADFIQQQKDAMYEEADLLFRIGR